MSHHTVYPRLSARLNNTVGLNVTFYNNGVPADPFALRRVDIYKNAANKEENLVARVILGLPDSTGYPAPIINNQPGQYVLEFDIPADFTEGTYFDVWRFIGGTPTNLTDFNYDDETLWINQCNRFNVSCDGWYLDDGLTTLRFGFEPLDNRFRKGELRNLEVGLMPLPLYDYDQSRVNSMITQIQPFITVETDEREILQGLELAPCKIGIRQGSFRTNPYVIQCPLDTSAFLKGIYRYRITLRLPNGEQIISDIYRFNID